LFIETSLRCFLYYRGCHGRDTQRKQPICRKSLTKFITWCCIEYTSPWTGFKLTTLVVISTDCTGRGKSNYHTITATTSLLVRSPYTGAGGRFDWFGFVVFNATFNNISTISWLSVLLVEETGVPEKTTDLLQVTDNYLCNQCLSPLMLWVWIVHRRGVLDTSLCDKSLSVTCNRSVVFSGTPVSSTNKTELHDIAEILLKVALNTLTHCHFLFYFQYFYLFFCFNILQWLIRRFYND
jgi:hypothetical protein